MQCICSVANHVLVDMDNNREQHKKWIEAFLIIVISTIISLFIRDTPSDGLLLLVLIFFAFILTIARFFCDKIIDFLWKINFKQKFKNPLIGVILEPDCEQICTKVTPYEWRDKFINKFSKTEFLSVSKINAKFSIILNPYGEIYPEEDTLQLKTFERIKQYISNGGIFVCAGGYPFYYGWDIENKRRVPLAKEVQSYRVMPNATLEPIILRHITSLIETPLFHTFRALTTMMTEPTNIQIFQKDSDKKIAGNLEDVGGGRIVREFRAIREPTSRCIPLLRAIINNKEEIYPLAAIPYGKGLLITAGMHLAPNNDTNDNILKTEIGKIYGAIEHIIERIQRGDCKPGKICF